MTMLTDFCLHCESTTAGHAPGCPYEPYFLPAVQKEWYIADGRCSCGSGYSSGGFEEILVGQGIDEWVARHPGECPKPPSAVTIIRMTDTEHSSIFDQVGW